MRLIVSLFSLFVSSVFAITPAEEANMIAGGKAHYESLRQTLCSECLKLSANYGFSDQVPQAPQARVGSSRRLNIISSLINHHLQNGQTDPYEICSNIIQQALHGDLVKYMKKFWVVMSEFTGSGVDIDIRELGGRFEAAIEEWIRNHGKCRENDRNRGPPPNPMFPSKGDSSRLSSDQQKRREAPPTSEPGSLGPRRGRKKQTDGNGAVVGPGASRSRDSGSTKEAAIKWKACMEPCMAGASDSLSVIGQLSTCMTSSCGFPFNNVNPIKVAQQFYNSNQAYLEDQFKKAGMTAVVAAILATIVAAILTAGAGAGAGAIL